MCYWNDLHALHCSWFGIVKWYFPSENFWIDLAHAYTCLWLEVYQALMIFLFQSSHITFMPDSMLLCRSAWLWPLLLSSWSLPRLLLAFTHTKRTSACASKILETSCAIWVHHTFLFMAFTGHPNEDFLVPSQNYSNELPFCIRTSSWSVRGNQYISC